MDKDPLQLKANAHFSYANNEDNTSQLGSIILLTDKTSNRNVLHFSSHISRRVTRSVLGAEVHAFTDAFDARYITKHDIQTICKQDISLIIMFTDSKSLFDVNTKCSSTLEKLLMIDTSAVHEAYRREEVSYVGFFKSECNPAGAFIKLGNSRTLENVLSRIRNLSVEQWIIRG